MSTTSFQKFIIVYVCLGFIFALSNELLLRDPFYQAIPEHLSQNFIHKFIDNNLKSLWQVSFALFGVTILLIHFTSILLCYRLKKIGRPMFVGSIVLSLTLGSFMGDSISLGYLAILEFAGSGLTVLLIYVMYYTELSEHFT